MNKPIVGKRYRTTNHPEIIPHYQNRCFVVFVVISGYVEIQMDGIRNKMYIHLEKWDDFVVGDFNIINKIEKFKFV